MKMGVVLQHFKIQRGKEFRTSQGSTRMAACGAMYHTNDISSNLCSNCFQIGHKNDKFLNLVGKSNGFLQKNAGSVLSDRTDVRHLPEMR
jgi:hypothetical protein